MASNGVTRPPALDVTMQEILDALKAVSFRPQVIDNLTSQDSGAPLSANQGRVLKDAIDDLVTQSITDGDTSHAPSGDAVHDALNAIRGQLGVYVEKPALSENEFIQKVIDSINPTPLIMYSVSATWTGADYYWITFTRIGGYLMGNAVSGGGRFLKIYGSINSVSVAVV